MRIVTFNPTYGIYMKGSRNINFYEHHFK